MTLKANVIASILLGVLLGGCGNGTDSADTSPTATPDSTAEATETPRADGTPESGGKDNGDGRKVKELTKAQLERARGRSQSLGGCLRESGATVSTNSNSPKSLVIKQGQGVVLRVTWNGGDAADIYVGGTRKNTRRTTRALDKKPVVYKKRVLLLYDNKPASEVKEMVEHCVSRKTV